LCWDSQKKKEKKRKKKGSSGCYFFGKFPESNKPRASSKSLKRTSLFHEITGGAPISQKVRYDRFCNYYYYYYYYYFRYAVISALGISENPGYMPF